MTNASREDIKQKALALLERLNSIKQDGAGSITIGELMALFGTPSDPAIAGQLGARGPVELSFGDDGSGEFVNRGPRFSVAIGPGTLVVPAEIGGKLAVGEQRADLILDQDRTMVGKALFMELKVQRLEVSDSHVAAQFPSSMFDYEIEF